MNSVRLTETIAAARECSVPILAVSTADQWATLARVNDAFPNTERVTFDLIRGVLPMNDASKGAVQRMFQNKAVPPRIRPAEALVAAAHLPEKSMLIVLNSQHHFGDKEFVQALSNLREIFKSNQRMVLLLAPYVALPPELAGDVITLDEDLPTDEELLAITTKLCNEADVPKQKPEVLTAVANCVRGLPAFTAEQVVALSLREHGIDLDDCWERKRLAVNQTPGLTFHYERKNARPIEEQVGGLKQIVAFLRRLFAGPRAPQLIVFIDEIEKKTSGSASPDTDSGVSKDQQAVMLQEMEDKGYTGFIMVGAAGVGKTHLAKRIAELFGIPMIVFDSGAMKGRYVGDSEARVRAAWKTIGAIGGGRVFVAATCNGLDRVPAPLRRRFKCGLWYVDLPTESERDAIWKIETKKHGIEDKARPTDINWTGAEIRNCCENAVSLGCSLKEAAEFIVPVAEQDAEGLEELRESAARRKFLSASYSGPYLRDGETKKGSRKITLGEAAGVLKLTKES